MLRMLKKLRRNERGNVLILTAAAMPLLLGSAGLAVDTIQWTLWKRQLQRAADSAALAGVYQRVQVNDTTQITNAVSRDVDVTTLFKRPANTTSTAPMLLFENPVVTPLADDGDNRSRVQVELKYQKPLSFSSIFMAEAPVIRAIATAASVPGSGEYCFVSLENSNNKTGITIGGNTSLELDCGMMSNSPAPNSALSNGNSSNVKATAIDAVGDIAYSNRWDVGDYNPYTPAIADPFANVNIIPADMSCFSPGGNLPILGTSTSNNFNGSNASVTLAAARATAGYTSTNCFRGLSVGSNETMTLPAGTYYIGEAGMNVQGTLNCTGCTFVLTRINPANAVGRLDVNAGASTNITAPTTGNFAHIAVYQDRNAIDSNSNNNRVNGNSGSVITGAVYFPKQELIYNGNGTSAFSCTRLVGRRLIFSGNSGLSNKFAKAENCPWGQAGAIQAGRRVRLVA